VIARALRQVVLIAMTGLIVAGCTSPVSSRHPSTTTTRVIEGNCANRVATPQVLESLVRADGRPGASTLLGSVFYGSCGKVEYAVASFNPSPSATVAESVAFQDHGAYPEFFERTGQSHWSLVGSAPGPPGPRSCTAFKHLPSSLQATWGDCDLRGTTTTTLAPWCVTLMAESFIQAQSVTVAADGTAALKGLALGVQCAPGTPDDIQFYDLVTGEAPETVHLIAGATITGVNLSGASVPLMLSALTNYLSHDIDGNLFHVVGPLDGATGLLGQFHP
jgi:hypothetical protein